MTAAVIEQMEGWETFTESAHDVAEHGADAGVSGFTYYSETGGFYAANKALINRMVTEMAEDFGQDPIDFVLSFNCLRGQGWGGLDIAATMMTAAEEPVIANALAWFALEEVCRSFDWSNWEAAA